MKKNKTDLKDEINIIIIVIFVLLAIIFSQYHENWADEAQSWLIARDNTVIEIFKYTKYEGTPCLWFLVIKLFITFGLTYEYFFVIPIFFNVIGLCIVLFKLDLPWYIKVLFPFSFFVFYQTTIICRSYCMILPAIMFLYLSYPKRFESPFKFLISLIFFMNISLHTYLIAGSIYLIYLTDFYKIKKNIEKESKRNIIITIVIIFLCFLVNLIILFPNKNIGFGGNAGDSIINIFGKATISSNNYIVSIIALTFLLIIYFKFFKDEEKIKWMIIFLPVITFLNIIHCQLWHISIIFFLIFIMLISKIDNKIIKSFIVIMLVIQNFWNINTLQFDYYNLYSSSKQVADFIKDIDNYNKMNIYGINYLVTAIQPYFEKNLFINRNTNKGNYSWSVDNGYDETLSTMPDICIIPITIVGERNTERIDNGIVVKNKKLQKIIKKLNEEEYVLYTFFGNHFEKTYVKESEIYLVYLKKDIKITGYKKSNYIVKYNSEYYQ